MANGLHVGSQHEMPKVSDGLYSLLRGKSMLYQRCLSQFLQYLWVARLLLFLFVPGHVNQQICVCCLGVCFCFVFVFVFFLLLLLLLLCFF